MSDNNRIKVNIYGSCVSRITLSHSKYCETGCYILQNPLHTMFCNPFLLQESDLVVEDDSNFMKRMAYFEFNKKGLDELITKKQKFLILDLADVRFKFIKVISPIPTRLIAHKNICETLNSLKRVNTNTKYEYLIEKSNIISTRDWEEYIDKFFYNISKVYNISNIILIKLPISMQYELDNKIYDFPKDEETISIEPLIRTLETYIITNYINEENVVEYKSTPIGDGNHRLGKNSLHYKDEVYENLANQLDKIIMLKNK